MRTIYSWAVAATAAVALSMPLAGEAPAAKTFDLRYRMPKGSTFSVSNTSHYANFRDADGRLSRQREMFAGMVLDYRVAAVEQDGTTRFEVTYRSRHRQYEDAAGVATPVDFRNLLGGRFAYRLSPRGAVRQLEGFEKLDVRLGDGREWSRDQLKSEIEHLLPHLPDRLVKVGDTWQGEVVEDGQVVVIEYRLTGEARIEGIDCVRFIARYSSASARTVTENGTQVPVRSRTAGNDVYYFAPREGMLVARVSTGQTETEAAPPDKPLRRMHQEEMYETRVKLR